MILFFDSETTGVEKKDKICSIGLVCGDEVHYELINPLMKIPPSASMIHHITNEMVAVAAAFAHSEIKGVLESFNSSENTIVMHNAPFDLEMLSKEGFIWQGGIIDTLKCSQSLMDDLDSYALQFLRYELRLYKNEESFFNRFGIKLTPHNAISDALSVRMIYEYLLDLASYDELLEISSANVLIHRLPFGKYAKRYIEEIVKKDSAYLVWMLSNVNDLDDDLRYSIEYFLKK